MIKEQLGSSSDLSVHEFRTSLGQTGMLLFMKGYTNKERLDEWILPWLMREGQEEKLSNQRLRSMPIWKDIVEDDPKKAVPGLLSGQTILLLEDVSEWFLLDTAKWPERSISKPQLEVTVKGGRAGFVESLPVNISQIRHMIQSPRLHVEQLTMGTLSKTQVAVLHVDGFAKPEILSEVKSRLKDIDADMVLGVDQISLAIDDNPWSAFPLIRTTDRPDAAAAALSEGKVAILSAHSPTCLLVPFTFPETLQNMDDYYEKWYLATAIRMVRLIAFFISLTLPALYVALGHYNPGLIPTDLLISMMSTRVEVPFPIIWELLIMEITMEFFRESGVRLPRPLGTTVTLAGGIVIGEAVVSAGLVGPITLIVVGLTALASFSSPSYSMAYTFRLVRVVLTLMAALLGLYGLVLGVMLILVHLASLKSFGVSYLSPLAPASYRDWVDNIFLLPYQLRNRRPSYLTKGRTKRK